MKNIGYKIVIKIRDNYYSLFAGGKDKVQYKKDEWVKANEYHNKPDGYHLTYFISKDDAIRFISTIRVSDIHLFSCAIKGKVELKPYKHLSLCYNNIQWNSNYYKISKWPDDTGMAKEIMLLEEVRW